MAYNPDVYHTMFKLPIKQSFKDQDGHFMCTDDLLMMVISNATNKCVHALQEK